MILETVNNDSLLDQLPSQTQPTKAAVAAEWLAGFSKAVSDKDIEAITALFAPSGFLRDMLVFTWDKRVIRGREKISAYLKPTLNEAGVSNIAMDSRPRMAPRAGLAGEGISFGIVFRTSIGLGRGFVNIDDHGLAAAALLTLEEIEGHPEVGPDLGGHQKGPVNWRQVKQQRQAEVEKDPYVLIGRQNIFRLKSMSSNVICSRRWASRLSRCSPIQTNGSEDASY